MFTRNFFEDNSQLNFGKHLTPAVEISVSNKRVLKNVLKSLIRAKLERKKSRRSLSALIFAISLMISLSLVITAFEWKFTSNENKTDLGLVTSEIEDFYEIPPTEQPPPPPPAKIRLVTIIEVPDMEKLEDDINIDLDTEITEDTKIEEVVFSEIEEEEEAEEIFLIVERAPAPIGGNKAFYQFVADNLKYPKEAIRASVGGKVYVQFVVAKNGSIRDVKVIKGIGHGCDVEALRIMNMVPDWHPGKQRGVPVNVRMIMPIHFKYVER